jgi:hypothetical protein
VRGDLWFYKPTPEQFIPSESIIQSASENRKVGMRGSKAVNRQSDVFIKRTII